MGPVERWLGRIPKRVGCGDWDKPLAKQVAIVFEPGSAGRFWGIVMDFGMGLVSGLFVAIIIFVALAWGMSLGLELAVDGTKKIGYFKAYGKEWRAEPR